METIVKHSKKEVTKTLKSEVNLEYVDAEVIKRCVQNTIGNIIEAEQIDLTTDSIEDLVDSYCHMGLELCDIQQRQFKLLFEMRKLIQALLQSEETKPKPLENIPDSVNINQ